MQALSLRMRLTLWYTLAIFVILTVFGAGLWWTEGRLGIRRADRELDGLSHTLANLVGEELREGDDLRTAIKEVLDMMVLSNNAVVVLDSTGAPITPDSNGLAADAPLPRPEAGGAWNVSAAGNSTWRVHADSYRFGAAAFTLLAGNNLADIRRAQQEVLEAMQIAIPLALLLAGGGGFWLASVGLRPIAEMAAQAARIAPTSVEDLGHGERRDELGQLARAFNGLVVRLRATLSTQRQFMADASHELRTPVSIMRMAADVALSREQRDEAEYREALATVGSQAQRLGRLVDNMLVLARADAGGYPLRVVDFYLDEVLADCCRALSALTAEHGVALLHDRWQEMAFRGDEDLVRQLLLNILQNAVQHTPRNGCVSVNAEQSGGAARIHVRDTGLGIAPSDRDRIFNRFVQLDAARRGAGAGLGLPIARWIAEAHGGSVIVEDSGPSGSVFLITLPLQEPV
jgi:signal transduction histidine kinase